MKKNYDYDKIEERVRSGMDRIERGIVYERKEKEEVIKEKKRGFFSSAGIQLAGAFLAAAIVGGGTFAVLKYAEHKGSRIEPGPGPGSASEHTDNGTVNTDGGTANAADEADASCTFDGVTVIDLAVQADSFTPYEALGGTPVDVELPVDHSYSDVRSADLTALVPDGIDVYYYKVENESKNDIIGVCVVDGNGGLIFDFVAWTLKHLPSPRLIIADKTPSGRKTVFFTYFSEFSGLYGGMTLVKAYDVETREVKSIPVSIPYTLAESGAYIGKISNGALTYNAESKTITYSEKRTLIAFPSMSKGNYSYNTDQYRLWYADGEYGIFEPSDLQTDTTADNGDKPEEYGYLVIEYETDHEKPYSYSITAVEVDTYEGGVLKDHYEISTGVPLIMCSYGEKLPHVRNGIRAAWYLAYVRVSHAPHGDGQSVDREFSTIEEAEEFIKDYISVSAYSYETFVVTVGATWDIDAAVSQSISDCKLYHFKYEIEYNNAYPAQSTETAATH